MNINKQILILLLSLISLSTFAQNAKKSLNYQAVILDPKAIDIPGANIVGQPLNKGNVCLRFSLLNAQGGVDYEETQQVTTDEYGLVNVAIGTGTQISSNSIYKSFESIVWNASVKSLKVSVSYDGCSSFKQVSTQALNYTPYSLYAEAVDYKNVREAPTKLSQFSNDSGYLIPKDLDPLKSDVSKNTADIKINTGQIATANQTIAENKKSSDATFLIVNQSINSLDTKVADNTTSIQNNTSSIGTINTKLTDQQNQISDNRNQISATNNNLNSQIGGLQGQINTTNSTVSNISGSAEVVSNKSTLSSLGGANPSDQLYPSQKAAKAYVDKSIYDAVGTGVPDATTLAAGKIQLSGDLTGTAAAPTIAVNAITTAKIIDGAVTDAKIATVSGSKVSGNIAGNSATSSKLATSRNINSVAFDGGSDITVTADAGTLTGATLKSTITGSSLTSVGTLASVTINGKAIVGASSAVSTSAVLEASSTTQGFLPPRMTEAQRNLINSPATGLMVYCSNCGSAGGEPEYYNGTSWVNMIGGLAAAAPHTIGETYGGGIVAYILQVGDPGYSSIVQHGLIVASSDQSGGGWCNCPNSASAILTNVRGTALGTGLSNTNAIIVIQGANTDHAAGIARAYNGGGYNDWYLPSEDELQKLYLNKATFNMLNNGYWSSTEASQSKARFKWFGSVNQTNNVWENVNKDDGYGVRAIRSF